MAVDSGSYTPETMKMRQRMAEAMMKQGMDTGPISSNWQGLSRLANALFGGMAMNRLATEEKDASAAAGKAMADALLGPSASAPTQGNIQQQTQQKLSPSEAGGDFMDFVRKQEGFNPNAYGDYKQTSIGYGTRARPGETSITREEGERRLTEEVNNARSLVRNWAQQNGVQLSPKREDALTDLTYNAGGDWMSSGLGKAAKAGDWSAAEKSFMQYTNAGGKPLPGLLARRAAAAPWLRDGNIPPPSEAALAAAEGMSPQEMGQPQQAMPTQVAQAPQRTMTDVPQQQAGVMGNERLRAMITSPVPQVRQMGIALATEAAKRGMAGRDVSFGPIGEDEYGVKTYGWIDKTGRTVTPVGRTPSTSSTASPTPAATGGAGAPPAAAAPLPDAAALSVQPPPPGVDPKEWRKIQTKRAATQAADKDRKSAAGSIVTDDIDRALKLESEATLPASGPLAVATQWIPGTNSYDVRNLLTTVKANAGFDRLQAMREASPTGGALGSVSNMENQLLQSAIGNLEQSQSPEQWRYNLKRVKNIYLDIVHGKGKGPEREALDAPDDGGWQDVGGVKIREKR